MGNLVVKVPFLQTMEDNGQENLKNEIDNPLYMDYLRNKLATEKYPMYQYYLVIKTVSEEILPEKELDYLSLLNLG